MGTGQWKLENGNWTVEIREWELNSGNWRMGTEQWELENGTGQWEAWINKATTRCKLKFQSYVAYLVTCVLDSCSSPWYI